MDIYGVLTKDHRLVQDLLEKIDALGNSESQERQELFNTLKEEVLVHSKAEQKAFYDELKAVSGSKDKVRHAEKEHHEVEALFEELTETTLAGAAWHQRFRTLAKSLNHHIEEEENEIFAKAQQAFDAKAAQEMGQAMLVAKEEAKANLDVVPRQAGHAS